MTNFEICDRVKCTGCGLCVQFCPKKCISMKKNYDGFFYPSIDYDKCINCGLCRRNCHINRVIKTSKSDFYMAINRDRDVLMKSSSGGAFSGIANLVLEDGGFVVGVSYNKNKDLLEHIVIDNKEDLGKLRLSKYYQSNMMHIYKDILNLLKGNKKVLFSGTACQIASLYSIVPEKYLINLLTVDVLCHGVSNKYIVNRYIESEERHHKKKIVDYNFRIKDEEIGWMSGGSTKMKLFFEDGSTYIEKNSIDSFFMAFNSNIILRESCYNCNYCGTERISDFTIADFWGVTEKRANKDEQKNGVSLLVCNSSKSKNLILDLEKYLKIEKIDSAEAIPYNRAFVEPNNRPKDRDLFFKKINNGQDFIMVVKKMFWKKYFKMSLKRILGPNFILVIKKIIRR